MAWLSRILAPIAFSPRDRGATQYAETLASHYHSQLMLLHVVAPSLGTFSSPEAAAYLTAVDTADEIAEQRKHQLDAFLGEDRPDIPLTEDVLTGDPAFAIVEYARQHEADLIVMATHGYGPVHRFFSGSVTDNVLHHAACPVLTGVHFEVPPERGFGFRRILCTLDLAKGSNAVLQWAAEFAEEFGAELTILHVLPRSVMEVGGVYFDPEWRRDARDAARQEISQLQRQAEAPGEVLIEIGDTALTVNDVAATRQADLVVIGRGSDSGLLGRLRAHAYAILRGSPCPVATI